MRGADTFTESLFTMRRLDDFVPANHPLRAVRAMVNQALKNIEGLLSGMYAADIKGGLKWTPNLRQVFKDGLNNSPSRVIASH